MQFIEVAHYRFINIAEICSVEIFTHEKIEQKQLDYGCKARPRKVGEKFTLRIVTSDGARHDVDEHFAPSIYEELFPQVES